MSQQPHYTVQRRAFVAVRVHHHGSSWESIGIVNWPIRIRRRLNQRTDAHACRISPESLTGLEGTCSSFVAERPCSSGRLATEKISAILLCAFEALLHTQAWGLSNPNLLFPTNKISFT